MKFYATIIAILLCATLACAVVVWDGSSNGQWVRVDGSNDLFWQLGAAASPYFDAPTGAVFICDFEDTNGVAFLDASGNSRHFTNYPNWAGGVTPARDQYTNTEGRTESYGSFDGSDDYLKGQHVSITSACTLSMWVMREWTVQGEYSVFDQFYDTGAAKRMLYFRWNHGSAPFDWELGLGYNNGAGAEGIFLASDIDIPPLTNWLHVCVQYSGSYGGAMTARLWSAGVITTNVIFSNAQNPLPDNRAPALIGSYWNISDFWKGGIDNVYMYDRWLTEAEVTILATYSAPQSNLITRPYVP